MNLKYLYIFFIFSSGIFGFGEDKKTEQQIKANKLLTLAVKTDNIKLAKKALDSGADVNLYIGASPPIYWALASTQNKEIAKFLITHGAMKSLEQYVTTWIFRYSKDSPFITFIKELKFAKEVIDEIIKEQSALSSEENAQAKKDISLAADLPSDLANLIASYTYSLPKEDLETLEKLSQKIKKSIGG